MDAAFIPDISDSDDCELTGGRNIPPVCVLSWFTLT